MRVPMDAFYGSFFQNACINYNFYKWKFWTFPESLEVTTFLVVLAGMEDSIVQKKVSIIIIIMLRNHV